MTKEEISKLPTLLDIVNHYLEGEKEIENRIKGSVFEGLFPTQAHKGLFEPVLMNDGTHILLPLSPAQHSYYRGENTYHTKCHPSLFREGMGKAEVFLERVKRCEMELMMQEYPITSLFANSIHAQAPDGNWHQLNFRVGYDGMAQHYGIKTEFLDITLNPWTAAFFAATTYDFETDTYLPITDTDKYQYGVFYLYNEIPMLFESNNRVDVVGMQPMLRPGRQSAYVYRMKEGENFNDRAQKTFFRHDAEVNKQIFNHVANGEYLFPKEIVNDKIRTEIIKGTEFSRKAFNEAKKRYFPKESDVTLMDYLEGMNLRISDTRKRWFTEAEKQDAVDYWETYKKELFSKICLRWSYCEN